MLDFNTLYNDDELPYLLISVYNVVGLSYLLITIDKGWIIVPIDIGMQ